MAASLVQIEKDGHRATIVESSLSVWVAKDWKLVTESDSQPEEAAEASEVGESDQDQAEQAGADDSTPPGAVTQPEPVAPAARQPAGAHQAPEPNRSREAQHG